ncbi:MAG: hypothetical protein RR752_06435, partial [Mucinivorans sp.]
PKINPTTKTPPHAKYFLTHNRLFLVKIIEKQKNNCTFVHFFESTTRGSRFFYQSISNGYTKIKQ